MSSLTHIRVAVRMRPFVNKEQNIDQIHSFVLDEKEKIVK